MAPPGDRHVTASMTRSSWPGASGSSFGRILQPLRMLSARLALQVAVALSFKFSIRVYIDRLCGQGDFRVTRRLVVGIIPDSVAHGVPSVIVSSGDVIRE
jgi:hypothetical protein